jgi:hypothetical protein
VGVGCSNYFKKTFKKFSANEDGEKSKPWADLLPFHLLIARNDSNKFDGATSHEVRALSMYGLLSSYRWTRYLSNGRSGRLIIIRQSDFGVDGVTKVH